MRIFTKSMIAALAVASAAAVAVPASADIVCSTADNVCWHVHRHYTYQPTFGVVVHPNRWTWPPAEHWTWREHVGRGYWHNGVWVAF